MNKKVTTVALAGLMAVSSGLSPKELSVADKAKALAKKIAIENNRVSKQFGGKQYSFVTEKDGKEYSALFSTYNGQIELNVHITDSENYYEGFTDTHLDGILENHTVAGVPKRIDFNTIFGVTNTANLYFTADAPKEVPNYEKALDVLLSAKQ